MFNPVALPALHKRPALRCAPRNPGPFSGGDKLQLYTSTGDREMLGPAACDSQQ